jgi:hypothetical protein
MTCHSLPDIVLRTTKGAPIIDAKPAKASFHQELNDQNCMACHSDHAGPKLTRRSRKLFSHALGRPAARNRRDACHVAPPNEMHKALSVGCDQCHKTETWKPATLEHAQFFPLDKDHNATCVTCRGGNECKEYSGYGCHEHSQANRQAKHREEGVSESLENCVRCHRSSSAEPDGRAKNEHGKRTRKED